MKAKHARGSTGITLKMPTCTYPLRALNWIAVKEFDLSCYIGETMLNSIYIYIHPLW